MPGEAYTCILKCTSNLNTITIFLRGGKCVVTLQKALYFKIQKNVIDFICYIMFNYADV